MSNRYRYQQHGVKYFIQSNGETVEDARSFNSSYDKFDPESDYLSEKAANAAALFHFHYHYPDWNEDEALEIMLVFPEGRMRCFDVTPEFTVLFQTTEREVPR